MKTFILSLILMGLAVIGLSIGLLITGKSKLKKGCGKNPKGRCTKCGKTDRKS